MRFAPKAGTIRTADVAIAIVLNRVGNIRPVANEVWVAGFGMKPFAELGTRDAKGSCIGALHGRA